MPPRSAQPTSWLAHYRELIRACLRRGHQRHDVEDAVQDAVVGMLEQSAGAIQDPGAYLRRSTYNGLIDGHRRRAVWQTSSLQDLAEADHPSSPGPESAARERQLSDALLKALEELPLKCQQVYIRHRLEGWSHVEIAQHMGLSRSMVEKYMTRALRHLSERLQDHAPN